MQVYSIIVAGGTGKRMGTQIPKQFLLLNGKPVLMHTIDKFKTTLPHSEIIVVLPAEQIAYWNKLITEHNYSTNHVVIAGGTERFFSVKNALDIIPENFIGIVSIHDGVRPLVSSKTILNAINQAKIKGASIPVINLNDSLRKTDSEGNSVHKNRAEYRLVQTPQCFNYSVISQSYKQDYSVFFTDDASVVEKAGHQVCLVEGNVENIKITSPTDLIIAEALLKNT